MARTQARILVSIWSDPEFLGLPPEPQRLYLFLLSQPNLGHAGLIALTVKRWARKATALSVDNIRNDLRRLETDGFIVMDEATEEVLVRTLVKNDGVWKQPKVMPAMAANAAEIESPALQFALRQELASLNLDELKPESRTVIQPILNAVLETLCDTHPDTVPDTPNQTAKSGVSDTHPDTSTRDARAASASASTSTTSLSPIAPSAAETPRPRDLIWEAVLSACEVQAEAITSSARGAYNRAVADLKAVGAEPAEIHRRSMIFRHRWPGITLTPSALAKQWAACETSPAPTPTPSRNSQALHLAMERAHASDIRREITP